MDTDKVIYCTGNLTVSMEYICKWSEGSVDNTGSSSFTDRIDEGGDRSGGGEGVEIMNGTFTKAKI